MSSTHPHAYYACREGEILALFDDHSAAWRPHLAARYGVPIADEIIAAARAREMQVIAALHYIGGDANPMTRHLIRSTTSLALYLAMQDRGLAPEEAGRIVYDAVSTRVRVLPPISGAGPTPAERQTEREAARRSQECCYAGDWVWQYVDCPHGTDDYGYDFTRCGTQVLYTHWHAGDFLPYYCYLDFVTFRTPGWGFLRSGTLAEGYDRCDFRFVRGAQTERGWPPPFARRRGQRAQRRA